jgi:hypothetical protein
MTPATGEPPPASGEPPREHREPDAEQLMPAWVPTLIGAILVAMAALAVYTGLRYRAPALTTAVIRTRRQPRVVSSGGAPGEPEAGASLAFPGEGADNTPAAHEAVTGHARAAITGTGTNITSMVRLTARRGLLTNVVPPDAMISVNDVVIGEASQFDSPNEIYDFAAPGSYTIHISAPGYKDQQFVVTVGASAKQEIARLDVKLAK